MLQLRDELLLGPRRVAADVPVREELQRLVLRERESPNQPATDAEGAKVAALASHGGRHCREVAASAFDQVGPRSRGGRGWRVWDRTLLVIAVRTGKLAASNTPFAPYSTVTSDGGVYLWLAKPGSLIVWETAVAAMSPPNSMANCL